MVHLQGDIGWDITLSKTIDLLKDGDRDITMMSFGGSLIEGWAIHDYVKLNKSVDSITAFGMIASSATIIMMASPIRNATPNSKFVIHNPWTMEIGDAAKLEKTASELKAEEDRLINFYADSLGKDYDTIKSLMAENRELTADEALELGLITDIIKFENMAEQVTKKDLETFENSFFAKIKNFFNPKNMVVQSTDGTELEFESGVESSDQIAVGQTLKAGGQPASGTFVLVDGVTVVADNGTITEVTPKEPEGDEMEALKKENEELKATVSELQNKVTELVSINDASKQLVEGLQNDFTAFKNRFSDDVPPGNTPTSQKKEEEKKKFSYTAKK